MQRRHHLVTPRRDSIHVLRAVASRASGCHERALARLNAVEAELAATSAPVPVQLTGATPSTAPQQRVQRPGGGTACKHAWQEPIGHGAGGVEVRAGMQWGASSPSRVEVAVCT